MLLDKLYKFLRKSLNRGSCKAKRQDPFRQTLSSEQEATYEAIFNHYCEQGLSFKNKTVIEVGPGKQGVTAARMLSAGAKQVILVEPAMSAERPFVLQVAGENTKIQPEYAEGALLRFRYLDEIPESFDHKIDIICSHFVLEHFHNLPSFFANARRLLSENGQCYSFVDLTDHTYHIFDAYPATRWIFEWHALNHLRYSNREYQTLSDERTYMNRLLLPNYLKLAETYRLKPRIVEIKNYTGRCRFHNDVLEQCSCRNQDMLRVTHFGLMLTPAATISDRNDMQKKSARFRKAGNGHSIPERSFAWSEIPGTVTDYTA